MVPRAGARAGARRDHPARPRLRRRLAAPRPRDAAAGGQDPAHLPDVREPARPGADAQRPGHRLRRGVHPPVRGVRVGDRPVAGVRRRIPERRARRAGARAPPRRDGRPQGERHGAPDRHARAGPAGLAARRRVLPRPLGQGPRRRAARAGDDPRGPLQGLGRRRRRPVAHVEPAPAQLLRRRLQDPRARPVELRGPRVHPLHRRRHSDGGHRPLVPQRRALPMAQAAEPPARRPRPRA